MARAKASNGQSGARRSGLLQERSVRTRHELVRAALSLWNARGFENGVEETTVEEIAQKAGVSKGTFYFHFANKDEILLEMGIETAEAILKEAELGMRRDRPLAEILQSLAASIARRVERAPRDAVLRSLVEVARTSGMQQAFASRLIRTSFADTFATLARYGVERDELPAALDAEDLGAVLSAVTMDTILRWAQQNEASLRSALMLHTELVVAGATSVYDARSGRPTAGR